MASWRAVLGGTERDAALSVVRDIGLALAEHAGPGAIPGLARGDAGMALFYAYAHEAEQRAGWAELAQVRLDAAADGVAARPVSASFYAGFSGVAWALDHVVPRSPADEDVNAGVDEALADQLAVSPWPGDHDLVSGLVGLGVFALDRMDAAAEPGRARACAVRVVDHLEALADERDGGLAWPTSPRFLGPDIATSDPDGLYDLGVAHGAPGVLVLLALLHARGVEAARTHRLLQQGFTWFTRQRNPDHLASRYGRWSTESSEPTSSRVAWCNGDLGIAGALLWAARAGGAGPLAGALEEEAILTAHRACARAASDCGVMDAGLCHGAAGLALLYARLYNATGEDRFRHHARLWYRDAIERRQPGLGIGGYLPWRRARGQPRTEFPDRTADAGLLTGAAGVGLSLLAGATEIEPAWDRALLISAPPR